MHFRTTYARADNERGRAFRRFVSGGGVDLNRFATFQALCERFGTHNWILGQIAVAIELRRGRSICTRPRRPRVFLSISAVAMRGSTRRYRCARENARYETRALLRSGRERRCFQLRSLGQPGMLFAQYGGGGAPDPFNEMGQEWGVVPLNPPCLRSTGYAHFTALLQANMRHAGAYCASGPFMGCRNILVIPAEHRPVDVPDYLRFPCGSRPVVDCRTKQISQPGHCTDRRGSGMSSHWFSRTHDGRRFAVLPCALFRQQNHGRLSQTRESPSWQRSL